MENNENNDNNIINNNNNNNNNNIQHNVERVNQRTAREVQQYHANLLGYEREIIWDLLTSGQAKNLKAKIQKLIPDQAKGQNAIINLREQFFSNIWAQRKYSNGNSTTALIFVLVTNETDQNRAKDSKQFSCHPVFRVRKCCAQGTDSSTSENCCMMFVDEMGRVYKNWMAYVADNVLPKGILVAPKAGIYTMEHDRVLLDVYVTPAASATSAALGVLDTTTTVGGLLSAAAPIAALCTIPVAAPVLAGAAVVGLISTGYMALRSGAHLFDRNRHEQSVSFADREARNSWLGVGAGVVGLGAAGATTQLTVAAATGHEASVLTQYAVNGLNVSALMLAGTGIASNIFDMYLKKQDDETISKLEVLQLAGSLVLFTHSAYNFRLASSIYTDMQDSTIRQFRESLSNRQRKAFNSAYRETLRVNGDAAGKMDVLRGVSEMPTKQEFNDLYKIRKDLNQRNVRASFGPNGEGFLYNGEKLVSTEQLRANIQYKIGPDILSTITQPIPETYQPIAVTSDTHSIPVFFVRPSADVPESLANISESDLAGVRAFAICSVLVQGGAMVALSDFGDTIFERITNYDEFKVITERIAKLFSEEALRFILNLTRTLLHTVVNELNRELRRCIGTQNVLGCIFKHIVDNYGIVDADYLHNKTDEIIIALQNYFRASNPIDSRVEWIKCKDCIGYYKLSNL